MTSTASNSPNDPREWDSVDNLSGAAGSDGVPDNYFQLRNPSSLEAALNRIFASVAGSVASGTAAAVVANNVSGEGAVYQALYHPRIEAGQNSITWAGTLHGLFIDGQGRLREDFGGNSPTTGNATLDGCDVDPVVEIFFDSVNLPTGTKIRRYSGGTADCSNLKIVTPTVRPLTDLKTLVERPR
jgi:type IV pilus assembly protein PilY1